MANQEHLDILKQGVEVWNEWRKEHPNIRPDLSDTDLSDAILRKADLSYATLSRTTLSRADLTEARVYGTIFGDLDLRTVKGLETIHHFGPSTIGMDTIMRSEGDIPEVFLRKAGLSDTFITYVRSLAQHPVEYNTCFISYSTKDQEFADRLLFAKKVLVWPGALFGPSGGDYVRLSYAAEDGRLREGLTRLADFVRELREKQPTHINQAA